MAKKKEVSSIIVLLVIISVVPVMLISWCIAKVKNEQSEFESLNLSKYNTLLSNTNKSIVLTQQTKSQWCEINNASNTLNKSWKTTFNFYTLPLSVTNAIYSKGSIHEIDNELKESPNLMYQRITNSTGCLVRADSNSQALRINRNMDSVLIDDQQVSENPQNMFMYNLSSLRRWQSMKSKNVTDILLPTFYRFYLLLSSESILMASIYKAIHDKSISSVIFNDIKNLSDSIKQSLLNPDVGFNNMTLLYSMLNTNAYMQQSYSKLCEIRAKYNISALDSSKILSNIWNIVNKEKDKILTYESIYTLNGNEIGYMELANNLIGKSIGVPSSLLFSLYSIPWFQDLQSFLGTSNEWNQVIEKDPKLAMLRVFNTSNNGSKPLSPLSVFNYRVASDLLLNSSDLGKYLNSFYRNFTNYNSVIKKQSESIQIQQISYYVSKDFAVICQNLMKILPAYLISQNFFNTHNSTNFPDEYCYSMVSEIFQGLNSKDNERVWLKLCAQSNNYSFQTPNGWFIWTLAYLNSTTVANANIASYIKSTLNISYNSTNLYLSHMLSSIVEQELSNITEVLNAIDESYCLGVYCTPSELVSAQLYNSTTTTFIIGVGSLFEIKPSMESFLYSAFNKHWDDFFPINGKIENSNAFDMDFYSQLKDSLIVTGLYNQFYISSVLTANISSPLSKYILEFFKRQTNPIFMESSRDIQSSMLQGEYEIPNANNLFLLGGDCRVESKIDLDDISYKPEDNGSIYQYKKNDDQIRTGYPDLKYIRQYTEHYDNPIINWYRSTFVDQDTCTIVRDYSYNATLKGTDGQEFQSNIDDMDILTYTDDYLHQAVQLEYLEEIAQSFIIDKSKTSHYNLYKFGIKKFKDDSFKDLFVFNYSSYLQYPSFFSKICYNITDLAHQKEYYFANFSNLCSCTDNCNTYFIMDPWSGYTIEWTKNYLLSIVIESDILFNSNWTYYVSPFLRIAENYSINLNSYYQSNFLIYVADEKSSISSNMILELCIFGIIMTIVGCSFLIMVPFLMFNHEAKPDSIHSSEIVPLQDSYMKSGEYSLHFKY